MFKHIALAIAAFGMLSSPVLANENAQMTRGEEKLAKLLDGRVAGEPQSCIRTLGSRNLSQIDGTALTYRDGDTVWVNYTRNPDSIDDRDIMVIDRFSGSSLCRTDQVKLVDRVNGFLSGILLLDEFVPYKKIDTEG